jgi:hypothetical protein
MNPLPPLLLPLLVLVLLPLPLARASPGDNLPVFKDCLATCNMHCYTGFTNTKFYQVPSLLRLLAWDCPSNCDYQCQQIATHALLTHGEPVEQFHGKWPFKRLLATQELASVVFSVLNFIPHWINSKRAWGKYTATRPTKEGGVKALYLHIYAVSIITSIAWVCSTVFHIRDLDVTEKLDYYFAGLTVLSGFHYLVIRVWHLHNNRQARLRVTALCAVLFLYHLGRLTWDWSYTYNMQANVFIALLQYSLLLLLAYRHYRKGRVQLAVMPLYLIGSVLFGMSFELFDFFWLAGQLDAHAVWHAVTVIPGFHLYDFFFQDVETLRGYID